MVEEALHLLRDVQTLLDSKCRNAVPPQVHDKLRKAVTVLSNACSSIKHAPDGKQDVSASSQLHLDWGHLNKMKASEFDALLQEINPNDLNKNESSVSSSRAETPLPALDLNDIDLKLSYEDLDLSPTNDKSLTFQSRTQRVDTLWKEFFPTHPSESPPHVSAMSSIDSDDVKSLEVHPPLGSDAMQPSFAQLCAEFPRIDQKSIQRVFFFTCDENIFKARGMLAKMSERVVSRDYSGSYRRLVNYNDALVRVGTFDLETDKYKCRVINHIDAKNLGLNSSDLKMSFHELSHEPVLVPTQQDWYNYFLQHHFKMSGQGHQNVFKSKKINASTRNNSRSLWNAVDTGNESQIFKCLFDGNVDLNYHVSQSPSMLANACRHGRIDCIRHFLFEFDRLDVNFAGRIDANHAIHAIHANHANIANHSENLPNLPNLANIVPSEMKFEAADAYDAEIVPILAAIDAERFDVVDLLLEFHNAQLRALKKLQVDQKLNDTIINSKLRERRKNSTLIDFDVRSMRAVNRHASILSLLMGSKHYKHFLPSLVESAELFRDVCIDINSTDNEDQTVLHEICASDEFAKLSYFLERVSGLAGLGRLGLAGLQLDVRDVVGRTALMLSSERGFWKCCSLLLYFGANVSVADALGRSILEYVVEKGNVKLCRFVLFCVADTCENMNQFATFFKRHWHQSHQICKDQGNHELRSFLQLVCENVESGSGLEAIKMVCKDKKVRQSEIELKYWDFRHQQRRCELFLEYLKGENEKNRKLRRVVMFGIVNATILMLEKRLPLCVDWIILSLMYLSKGNNCEQKREHYNKLLQLLRDCVQTGLSPENPVRKRDHLWFRKYLLGSNLWHHTYRTETGSKKTLFKLVEQAAKDSLAQHQEFLKETVEHELKHYPKYWAKLVTWPSHIVHKHVKDSEEYGLRQDKIKNGIQPQFSAKELFVSRDSGFNGIESYDLNSYLYSLLIAAHAVNDMFTQQVKTMFEISPFKVKFKSASVKDVQRCQIKVQSDYQSKPFPKSAQLVDLNRCSLTFANSKDLVGGIKHFVELVGNGNGGCIKAFARVKNSFAKYKDYNIGDCKHGQTKFSYTDVKLNVIIEYKGKSLIGEIQFILEKFMEWNKKTHALYEVLRSKDYVQAINEMIDTTTDKNGNKEHLSKMVLKKDYSALCHHTLVNTNKIMASAAPSCEDEMPLLYDLHKSNWQDGIKLFYSSLLHFDRRYNRGGQWTQKYMSHPALQNVNVEN